MRVFIFLLLILSCNLSFGYVPPHRFGPGIPDGAIDPKNAPTITHGVFQQRVDHFNRFDSRRFDQRYAISTDAAVNSKSPVLLYICGEMTCDDPWISMVAPWAATIHANVVIIEHRYYGRSQPFATLTADTLKYLTIPQALEDFADIVRSLKEKNGLVGPWVVAGGSYGGMLASALRLYHSDLFNGAWASSATWNVTEFYGGYDKAMTQTIGAVCADHLRTVISNAEAAVQNSTTFANLLHLYGADSLTDPRDFLFSISDVAAAAVQYGYTNTLCNDLNVADPVQGYAVFSQYAVSHIGYGPTTYSFANATDTTAAGPQSDLRAYFYQECSEFGLFQTAYADPALSVRSRAIDGDYMRAGCKRLFGKNLHANIDSVLHDYYKPMLKHHASEIFFTNGGVDPYGPLGISAELGNWINPKTYATTIPKGSHCDDLYFTFAPTDAHKAVHAEIALLLQKWTR